MTASKRIVFWGAALVLTTCGCSSVSVRPWGKRPPTAIWAELCPAESPVARVQGEVWMKVESPELTGQFPAGVRADAGRLALEVTNLLGAPQAWIKLEGKKREIRLSAENQKKYRAEPFRETWGGIPLSWAPDLFRGGLPCPKGPALEFYLNDDVLEVREPDPKTRTNRRFAYRLRAWGSRVLAESLRVESQLDGKPWVVDFEFHDPEDPHGLPKRWSASSSRGKIEARWKNRKVFSPAEVATPAR